MVCPWVTRSRSVPHPACAPFRCQVQGRAACEELDNINKKLAECKLGPVAVPDAIDARRAADSIVNLRNLVCSRALLEAG
jgi:hypothetical protein